MDSDALRWYLWGAVKLVFLALPAAWILRYWRHKGVVRRPIFYASCANLFCYALWVALILMMLGMQGNATPRSIIPVRLPAITFVFIPFLLSIASLPLCLIAVAAGEGERRYGASANALMLVVWLSSVVAPN